MSSPTSRIAAVSNKRGSVMKPSVRAVALILGLLASMVVGLVSTTGVGLPTAAAAAVKRPQSTLLVAPFVPTNRAIPLRGHVSGVAKPTAKKARLQLKRGKKWVTVASQALRSSGDYKFTRKHKKAGTVTYRVRIYAGSKRLATSPTRKVHVGKIPFPHSSASLIRDNLRSRAHAAVGAEMGRTGWNPGYFRCSEPQHYAQLDHPFITGNGYSWWWGVLAEGNNRTQVGAAGGWFTIPRHSRGTTSPPTHRPVASSGVVSARESTTVTTTPTPIAATTPMTCIKAIPRPSAEGHPASSSDCWIDRTARFA